MRPRGGAQPEDIEPEDIEPEDIEPEDIEFTDALPVTIQAWLLPPLLIVAP